MFEGNDDDEPDDDYDNDDKGLYTIKSAIKGCQQWQR